MLRVKSSMVRSCEAVVIPSSLEELKLALRLSIPSDLLHGGLPFGALFQSIQLVPPEPLKSASPLMQRLNGVCIYPIQHAATLPSPSYHPYALNHPEQLRHPPLLPFHLIPPF